MTDRTAFSFALAIGLLSSAALDAQNSGPAKTKAQVDIVQTVGCVSRRGGERSAWWLTKASAPTVTRDGVFNRAEIDDVKKTSVAGTREFHLIGVADFLDSEGLLHSGDRAQFTKTDQVNATGELREGRTVLVKGLLIDAGTETRINLTAVVGIADTCR